MNALAPGQEIIVHRVVVAPNAVACATCGSVPLRRPDGLAEWRWLRKATMVTAHHRAFPAAVAPGPR